MRSIVLDVSRKIIVNFSVQYGSTYCDIDVLKVE